MARTKQILSERRHAIVQAANILKQRGEDEAAALLLQNGAHLAEELEADSRN